VKSAGRRRGCV